MKQKKAVRRPFVIGGLTALVLLVTAMFSGPRAWFEVPYWKWDLSKYGNTPANLLGSMSEAIAVQGTELYHSTPGPTFFFKMKQDGTETEILLHEWVHCINIIDNWAYFIIIGSYSDMSRGIYRMNTETNEPELLLEGSFSDLNAVDDWLYFSKLDNTEEQGYMKLGIWKMRTDGSDLQCIVDQRADNLIAYRGWLYFTMPKDSGAYTRGFYRANYAGNGLQKIREDLAPYSFMIFEDWIYLWGIDFTTNTYMNLSRMRLDGSDGQLVCEKVPWDVNAHDKWIYYRPDGNIYRIRPNGTEKTLVIEGDCTYFAIAGNQLIYRRDSVNILKELPLYIAELDGSNPRRIDDDTIIEDWWAE